MPSPSTPTSPTNLPADASSFVGRRRETADARRLLSSGRWVTLTGAGGVGKTRLAVQVARSVRRDFPGGVWLVELASLRDGDDVAHAVADVLGLRDTPGTSLADALAAHVADRTVLLVVDNCEHMLHAVGELVHHLLVRCANLRVVATSREPFGVSAEHVLAVPPLPFPDPGCAPEPQALGEFDSVDLFVQRAAAASADFALTTDNSAAVLDICCALEGIPLAIELAAVRVRALPLQAILQNLKDRSQDRSARRDPPGHPGHHRTLRASVEWSYDLCSPEERTLWSRLSVFAGGFDLDAAHAVCAEPADDPGRTADLVASLVEKSVVVHESTGSRRRYRMLEILREFGAERLADVPDAQADAVARHRRWFVALAEARTATWLGGDQAAILAHLHSEYGNLRAAFSRALADPASVTDALAIASDLENYWLVRGWQSEGRQWLDEALAAATASTSQRARALRVNSYLTVLQGDPRRAVAMTAAAREIAAEVGDDVELGYVTMVQGVIGLAVGDLTRARGLLETALDCFERRGHTLGIANTLVILVAVAAAMEDASLAELCHRHCMALTAPGGEAYLRGFSLWGRSLAALRDGDVDHARDLQRESLRLKRSLDDRLGIVLCIEALAWIDVAQGQDARAALLLGGTERLWPPMRMTIASIPEFGRFGAAYEDVLRSRLGARFAETARRGSRMTIDQLCDLALGEQARAEPAPSPLTDREREIAELVARGLTNRSIAGALTLSPRTVEGHVEKIMGKLGFTRRTQIAAWAVARGAAPATVVPAARPDRGRAAAPGQPSRRT